MLYTYQGFILEAISKGRALAAYPAFLYWTVSSKGRNEVFPVQAMKAYRESRSITPLSLNL
jgi:hypothetical protein